MNCIEYDVFEFYTELQVQFYVILFIYFTYQN